MKNKTEIVKSVSSAMNKTMMKVRKHSPEILVVAGIAGTVVSAIIACKATTKVNKIVEDTKNDIDKVHTAMETGVTEAGESYSAEDSKKDLTIIYVQTGIKFAKLYAPAIILGTLSIMMLQICGTLCWPSPQAARIRRITVSSWSIRCSSNLPTSLPEQKTMTLNLCFMMLRCFRTCSWSTGKLKVKESRLSV